MQKFDYLIIGGGAAGTTAAETVRQADPNASIAIIDQEGQRLYSRIMLADLAKGGKTEEQITLRRSDFYQDKQISLVFDKAIKLDPKAKTVHTVQGTIFNYNKLLLATGAKVRPWNVKGANLKGVVQLQTLADAQTVRELSEEAEKAVVVGGRFIALDFINIFLALGLEVTALVREEHFFEPVLDETGARILHRILEDAGVKIKTEIECVEVIGDNRVAGVKLNDGSEVPVQIVGVGIGVERNLELARMAGIKTNQGIITDQYLKTNRPDIWATGDCAEVINPESGEAALLGTWTNAVVQGRIAAFNMLGKPTAFAEVSSYTMELPGDKKISVVGDCEPAGKETVVRHQTELEYERIFLKDGRIVGATLVNYPADLPVLTDLIKKGKGLGL